MGDNVILMEIIIERASDQQIAQLCGSLSNGYYSANAAANNTYTFGWGMGTGLSGNVKLNVGAVGVLLAYNGSTQKVEAIGTCGNGTFQSLSVINDTTLQYADDTVTFTVQFHLVDGASIEISAKPTSNTSISAED